METSFEVVTILFNFHRWTCVVGPLALAMSLAKSVLRSAARLLIIANQYTCMAVDLVTHNKIWN